MNYSLNQYQSIVEKGFKVIPLMKEIFSDTETPVSIFYKVSSRVKSFLLESVEHKEEVGRYSFVGYDAKQVVYMENNRLFINGKEVDYNGNPLKVIDKTFINKKVYRSDDIPPFLGGLVGYISYETVRFFDKINFSEKPGIQIPEFAFFWIDNLISVDNFNQKIQIIVLTYPDPSDPDKSYQQGEKKIEEIISVLRSDLITPKDKPNEKDEKIKLRSNIKREDFYKKVEKCKDYIKAGDALQIVFSQRFSTYTEFSPFTIYRALRSVNPSPYMYYLDFDKFQIIGSSPEVMVKLDQKKNILLKPIAGTRPRGKTKEEDADLADELLVDEKEKAEHIMLVDLGRNDIGRISIPGSVKVSELMKIERYSHVMHIVSTVTGKVNHQFDWVDALKATFPAGTLSGAPKIRAIEIIEELEPTRRGPYGGSVMYVSADGVLDSCITIRTIIHQKGDIYGQAGAGIVYDSVPEKEYMESINKVKALFSSINKLKKDIIL